MKVYLAPPRGPSELVAFKEWLVGAGLQPVVLDLETQITGPLILAGGADIGKDPERDANEFWWIQQALSEGHPIIGVCRGMQILNYYFGGTVENIEGSLLESHAAASFEDAGDHGSRPSQFHLVTSIDGFTQMVNSRHHQYCAEIAPNFIVTHRGNDIVEGIVDPDRNIWAVQWHPERAESDNNLYPLDKIIVK